MGFKKFSNRDVILVLILISIFGFVKGLQAQNVDEDIKKLQMDVSQKGYTFKVGMTSVSKIPLEKLCGLKEPIGWQQNAVFDKGKQLISGEMEADKIALPSSFDWRTSGKVTPVKNQGGCGSCWDFATVGSYEGAIAVVLGELADLSEQYILDCNSHGYSCSGGWWVFDNLTNGIPLESCYPYTAVKGTCKTTCPKYYPLESWYYVGTSGGVPPVDAIKNAIYYHGPIAVAVYVNSYFQNYTGGVFNACTSGSVNHGVVLVGWNDSGGYWILKNSWGPGWGENGYMRIAYGCCQVGYAAAYGIPKPKFIQVPGVGWEGQGAGMAITNLDTNARPEMILMAYDNPAGNNSFRYKIGWNLNASGIAAPWSNAIQVPGVGWEGQGAGVSVVNLDANPRPEMILMAYDNPAGNNSFRYKIGWNLNTAGIAAPWSNVIQVPGVGWEGQGAGIFVVNLDSNPRPEMILMAYDNPAGANSFRYKIGWNLNTAGIAASWSSVVQIPGVGWEGQGAGVSVVNLDANPRPEMILMAYDNPAGANSFRYKIGWNLNTAGIAAPWGNTIQIPGVGWEGQGADIAVCNLDANPAKEFIFMAYDNPAGDNSFRYMILFNQ